MEDALSLYLFIATSPTLTQGLEALWWPRVWVKRFEHL